MWFSAGCHTILTIVLLFFLYKQSKYWQPAGTDDYKCTFNAMSPKGETLVLIPELEKESVSVE